MCWQARQIWSCGCQVPLHGANTRIIHCGVPEVCFGVVADLLVSVHSEERCPACKALVGGPKDEDRDMETYEMAREKGKSETAKHQVKGSMVHG